MAKTPTKSIRSDNSDQPAKKKRGARTGAKGRSGAPATPRQRAATSRAGSPKKLKIVAVAESTLQRDGGEPLRNAMTAVEAARSKLARNMLLLDLRGMADFTDFFFICSGTNPRQVQAICDEINLRMKQAGLRTTHTEGYNHAEWVLLDYVDFVAHVFTEQARDYYDLERLWRTADRIPLAEAAGR